MQVWTLGPESPWALRVQWWSPQWVWAVAAGGGGHRAVTRWGEVSALLTRRHGAEGACGEACGTGQ